MLRPGGLFAHVTWLADDRAFAPDRIFDRLLDEYGFENDEDPEPPRATSRPPSAPPGELRRAGFRDVAADGARCSSTRSRSDGYISFLTEFDEESLFDEMGRPSAGSSCSSSASA